MRIYQFVLIFFLTATFMNQICDIIAKVSFLKTKSYLYFVSDKIIIVFFLKV